jgi:hypothetical protein
MNSDLIKVGFIASYDYEYLKESIPPIYQEADKIYIAFDKNRKTWSGKSFEIKDKFFTWLLDFDKGKKIEIYEDDFCVPGISNMENETRERNLLADKMESGGWHIQLDTDEYFVNFKEFVHFLKEIIPTQDFYNEPICVYTQLITLFKKTKNGFLYIKSGENAPIATRHPVYTKARAIDQGVLYTNFEIIHQSWAREEEEIQEKLNSWGHKEDFNIQSYFNFWKVCDEFNYKCYNNFNPVDQRLWDKLELARAASIQEFIAEYNSQAIDYHFKYHPLHPKKKNILKRIKAAFK